MEHLTEIPNFPKGYYPESQFPESQFPEYPNPIFPNLYFPEGTLSRIPTFPKGNCPEFPLSRRDIFPNPTFPKGDCPKFIFPKSIVLGEQLFIIIVPLRTIFPSFSENNFHIRFFIGYGAAVLLILRKKYMA